MPRLFRSTAFRSSRCYLLALLLLTVGGLFFTSHTRGDNSGGTGTVPPPKALFDPSLYTPEQLNQSTLNDGIPDVWKQFYGFDINDPALATADYTGDGVPNYGKYALNIDPGQKPETPLPPPLIKPPAMTKSLAAPAPTGGAALLPSPPLLANGNFSGTAILNHTSTNGYGGVRYEWGYNTTINGWKALHGSQIEVWSVNGNQFIELDASNGSYGIKQEVVSAKVGTYVLVWKHRGRDSRQAGSNAYRAFVYSEKAVGLGRNEIISKSFPVIPQTISKTTWVTQVLVFTVTNADLTAAGGLKKSLWIAFEPNGNNTYGTLIDDVSLAPIEVMQPKIGDDGNVVQQDGKDVLEKVDAVRMCRWGSKHDDHFQAVDNGDRSKFPDHDPDGAVIKIPDAISPGASSITVRLGTAEGVIGYNDSGANLTFTKKAEYPGYFVSDRIVIVADRDDDSLRVGAGRLADNADGDRSFIGQPGGKLVFHSPTGDFPDFPFLIMPFAKQVKVQNVYSGLTPTEKGNFALAILENKKRLREIFAPHGIKVYDAAKPVDITASDLGDKSSLFNKSTLTTSELDQIALLLKKKGDGDAIKLVWLKSKIKQTNKSEAGGYTAEGGWCFINLDYITLLKSEGGGAQIPHSHATAHEVGHALCYELYATHRDGVVVLPPWHLMSGNDSAAGMINNGIRPDNPDASGKHLFVKDTEISGLHSC